MHCYCSNKSLSILAALFVANFVFGCGRVKEGFEEAMKEPADLLKDAASAAAQAGGQLVTEGADDDQIKACSAITGALLDTSAQCDAAKKEGKSDGAACNYQVARCMKDGNPVAMLADGTTATTKDNCNGAGGAWEAATCSQ